MKHFILVLALAFMALVEVSCKSKHKSQDQIEATDEASKDASNPKAPKPESPKDQEPKGTGTDAIPMPKNDTDQKPAALSCSWKGISVPDQKWAYDSSALQPFSQCVAGKWVNSNLRPANTDIIDFSTEKSCTFAGKVVFDNLWAEVVSTAATYKFCQCDNGVFPQETCSNVRPNIPEANIIKI